MRAYLQTALSGDEITFNIVEVETKKILKTITVKSDRAVRKNRKSQDDAVAKLERFVRRKGLIMKRAVLG